jgi:hypothetical protein
MSSRNSIHTLRDKNHSKKARNRTQGRKLLLEQLEDRRVLAAGFFQGFEVDIAGWIEYSTPDTLARVASGTAGITSSAGGFHGVVKNDYTAFGGYTSTFPATGYTTSIDIYLNVNGGYANDTRFDWTVASSKSDGGHLRDFAFNAGFYNDSTAPGADSNRFVISASPNAQRPNSYPKNPGRDPIAISTTGWYTFQHHFRNNSGVLAVDLSILDSTGGLVKTWTLSDPGDTIPTVVGGNRYGWFAQNEFTSLAIDNTLQGPATTVYVNHDWASVALGEDPDGSGPAGLMGFDAFATIEQGINAVSPGGTVQVYPGTYAENLDISKPLTLQGAKAGIAAGVDPGARGTDESVLDGRIQVLSGAAGTTIDGFEILGGTGGGSVYYGVRVLANDVSVVNNRIFGDENLSNTQGIDVTSNLSGLVARDNEIKDFASGLYINPHTGALIQGNYLHGAYAGIGSDGLANTTIANNRFANNTEGLGASSAGINVTVFNNDFDSTNTTTIAHHSGNAINASGNWWGSNDEAAIKASIRSDGTLDDATKVDFTPFLNTDTQGGATPGEPGFQGDFSTLNVTALGAQTGATGRIQEGINLVSASTVNVGPGTYNEDITINKALTLLGAQAGNAATGSARTGGESVIAGTGNSSSFVVTVQADNVTIDGFEITPRLSARDGINVRTGSDPKPGDATIGGYRENIILSNNWIHSAADLINQRNAIVFGEHTSNGNVSFNGQIEDVEIVGNYIDIPTIHTNGVSKSGRGLIFTNQFRNSGATIKFTDFTITDNLIMATNYGMWSSAAQGTFRFDNAAITNNTFKNSVTGIDAGSLYGSVFSGNTVEDMSSVGAILGVIDSTVENNTFRQNQYYGLGLWGGGYGTTPSANSLIKGNAFDYNDVTTGTGVTYRAGLVLRAGGTSTTEVLGTTGVDAASITLEGNTFSNEGTDGSIPTAAIIQRSFGTTLNPINTSGNPAKDNDFNGIKLTNATAKADLFAIADQVVDNVDVGNLGSVVLNPANVYVTESSFFSPMSTTVPSIQRGVNAASAGDTVNVATGTYVENVSFGGTSGLTVLGPHAGTIATDASRGTDEAVIQGSVTVSGSGALSSLVFDGFTIESGSSSGIINVRLQDGGIYNNILRGAWVLDDTPSTPNINGIITASSSPVQPQSWELVGNDIRGYRIAMNLDGNLQLDGVLVKDNYLADCERGIQTQTSLHAGMTTIAITENTITNNMQGIRVTGGNTTISRNLISNNSLFGISPGANGVASNNLSIVENTLTGNGVGLTFVNTPSSMTNLNISNNSISGGTTLVNTIIPVNVSSNWWGSNVEADIAAKINGITNVDFTPYLASGTDTVPATPGFQGDFSTLYVTEKGDQTQSGGRINEAIGLVTASTVIVNDGIYNEDVLVNKNNLTLRSVNGSGVTTINGQAQNNGTIYTNPGIQNLTLGGAGKGFTVYPRPTGGHSDALHLAPNNSGHIIRDNVLVSDRRGFNTNNALEAQGGQSNHLIQGNTFSGSASQLVYVNGVVVSNPSPNVQFIGNTFSGSATGPLLGLEGDDHVIQGNTFTGATGWAAIEIFGDNNTLDNNTLTGTLTGKGVVVDGTYGATVVTLKNMAISGYEKGGEIGSGITTVHWETTDGGDTVLIDGAASEFSASGEKTVQAIEFDGLTTLNVKTLNGQDTVTVSPHPTTKINLDGGDPTDPPGDTLIYVSDGTNAFTFGDPTITTQTKADIDYVNFETTKVSGNLVLEGTGDDDLLLITASDSNSGTYQLTSGGVAGPVVDFSGITSLTFDAGEGYDILRIIHDFAGVFAPSGGVVYDGGANGTTSGDNPGPGDSLEILGGSASSVEHRLLTASSGEVQYNGSTDTDKISYTGLEPVLDTIVATDRTFTFKGAGETITLSDDATAGDDMSLIDSDLSESINFLNPSGSLTIKTTDTAGTDAIKVQGLDSAFNANLTITAKTSDTVTFQTNATDLDSGDLDVTAGTIVLDEDVTTSGDATLNATTAGISNGAWTLTATDLDASAISGIQLNTDVATISAGVSGAGGISIDEADGVTLTSVTTNNGPITVEAGGAIEVDEVSAPGNTVTLDAAGAITDGNVGNLNVTAALLDATAGGGIELDTDVDEIEATAAGAIVLREANGVILTSVVTADGPITITAAGTVEAVWVISSTDDDDNDITISTTSGDIVVDTITAGAGAYADVFLTASAGKICEPLLITTVTGDVLTLTAATGIDLNTIANSIEAETTGEGDIVIREADAVTLTSVETTNGTIEIDAGGTITAELVTAGGTGDVMLTATASEGDDGDIALGVITAADDTVLLQAAGAITGVGSGNNVTASQLAMVADAGIGSGDALETAVSTLAAHNSASGNIQVANNVGGLLTIGSVTLPGTSVTLSGVINDAPDGTVVVTNASPVTVAKDVSADGDVTIEATDTPDSGDNLTVETAAVVSGDNIYLRAGDDLLIDAGAIVAAAGTVALAADYEAAESPNPVGVSLTVRGLVTNGTLATATTGAGADAVTFVQKGSGRIDVDAGAGNDTYNLHVGAGSLDGRVHIADTAGTDTLNVTATTDADEIWVSFTHESGVGTVTTAGDGSSADSLGNLTVGGSGTFTSSVEFLNVYGGDGEDLIHVQPSLAAGTEILIDGGAPSFGDPITTGDVLDFDPLGYRFLLTCGKIETNPGGTPAFGLVRYRDIESLPLGENSGNLGTTVRSLDFNPATGGVTQAGYNPVTPGMLYDGNNGNEYGWRTAVNGLDRGDTLTSEYEDLLRDGHWHSFARTFTAEVVNGWYLVSIKTGDKGFARDQLRVTNPDTGQVLVENASSPAGEIATHSFVMLVTDETLDLTFADMGGDPYWVVNGIEIRPGKILTFGTPAQPTKSSDGISQTTFSGYLATPGKLVTVLAEIDTSGNGVPNGPVTITTADADPDLVGVQIRANDLSVDQPLYPGKPAGYFEYTLVHPSQPGTVYVKFDEASGDQKSCVAIKFQAPPAWQFDFNTPSSPTQMPEAVPDDPNGYIGVLPTDLTHAVGGLRLADVALVLRPRGASRYDVQRSTA